MTNLPGPPGLIARVDRAQAKVTHYRRMWIAQNLETLGIKGDSLAGTAALAEYDPYDIDPNGDFSLLAMRTWLAERMGMEIV
jgi:hypothetical protein